MTAEPQAGHVEPGIQLGIIIDVPEPYRSELRDYRWSFGDEMAKVVPPHITLLSEKVVATWDEALAHARRVCAGQRPFTVELDGTGTFRPVSPVVFLELSRGVEECRLLADRLNQAPLDIERRFPYHPHVTVAHDIPEARLDEAQMMLQSYQADFTVDRIGVYLHSPEGVWHLKEEIRFGNETH